MATAWASAKTGFKNRFDALNTVDTTNQVNELNTAIEKYVAKGGLNKDASTSPEYNTILEKIDRLNEYKESYQAVYTDINSFLKTYATENSLADTLSKNGTLKTTIQQLSKMRDGMKTDVESAVAREELLRSRETDMTRHDLFLFGRPVRRGMIPYLWLIGVLFIGIGLCVFYMAGQTLGLSNYMYGTDLSSVLYSMITEFFTNTTVLIAIISALVIVIIALGLKIGGVFG
jgi:hypothetical protein